MKPIIALLIPVFLLTGGLLACVGQTQQNSQVTASREPKATDSPGGRRVVKTNAEWKKILTADQYAVMREKGTERAGTSPLNRNKEKGVYACAGCRNPLFSSAAKFESGTGWPSFYEPIAKNAVHEEHDRSYGMDRVEILCSVCDAHLGHVFDDGPKPTGLRYCMNGVALSFEKK
ncbi:peptide-methionine (R)-S-oxide reductase MsrB [Nibrella saemangeumensis]|uniref:peptide-methionine (R)-S-oxide reductase n=1 Tax=Nibrella saemangeumensis TaxID=1084526 RepID=A0ABP8MRT9_9BACT